MSSQLQDWSEVWFQNINYLEFFPNHKTMLVLFDLKYYMEWDIRDALTSRISIQKLDIFCWTTVFHIQILWI